MKNQFWFGVVENRNDPLKLGRYQVRVVGIHTEDLVQLPTSDLPWATTLQPTTSAAVSGVGLNPGLVNGSWVMVVFTNTDFQVPIILGSIAGIPGSGAGQSEGQSAPIASEATPTQKKVGVEQGIYPESVLLPGTPYLGSLTEAQYKQLTAKVRLIESTNNYLSVNSRNYIGAYQFGAAALEDLGYIKAGSWAKFKSNTLTNDAANWTGKDGCINKLSFLANKTAQDSCMLMYSQRAYRLMSLKGQAGPTTDPRVLAGLIGAAHNQGTGVIAKLIRGVKTVDGNGTTALSYYNKCYAAITVESNQPTNTTPTNDVQPIPEESDLIPAVKPTAGNNTGFKDPEGKYPTGLNEADTHKLVRGQNIDKTIVSIKEKERRKNINIGLSSKVWDQPSIQYAAQYPYNHAYVSETGHMLEFDDTHKAERVQLYHRSGSFIEIDQAGNQVNKIVGHGVEIIEADGHIFIKGNGHINIEGNFTLQTDNAFLEMKNVNIKSEKTVWHANSFDFNSATNFSVNADNISLKSKSATKINAGGNMEMYSGGATNIKAAGIIAEDGSKIHLNSGMSKITDIPTISPLSEFTGDIMNISAVSRSDNEAAALDDNPHASVINADMILESQPVTAQQTVEPAAVPEAVKQETGEFDLSKGDNIQLSPNYKLKDLCKDGAFNFAGQHKIPVQTLLKNLSMVCINVLEPLRRKYGKSLIINSGFRPAGSPVSKAKGISQHETGEAVDVGFSDIARGSTRKAEYFKRAVEIQPTLPYDQFLFESYSKGDTVWIHISYSQTKQRKQVLTLVDGATKSFGKLVLIT